ncbi:MAG: hypothetical protein K6F59_02680 [Gammaproteobacteria bacterium]|nr:hypothetical protein [Gammaproteobacteria bacterium]
MNTIYAGMNFWIVVAIAGAILLGLIIAYIFVVKHNTKRFIKKSEKKIEKDKKKNLLKDESLEEMIVNVFEDPKYNGKYNSFSGKNKKIIKKFILQFFENVCPYGIVKGKQETKKYQRLQVVVTPTKEFEVKKVKSKNKWVYDSSIKEKKLFKKLVKFGNKQKVMKSIVDVFSRTYKYFKNKEEIEQAPQAIERDMYITLVMGK